MEDLILQTKLQPPLIKGKILHRARLLNLLIENLDKKLILICADAGYGKTTLLAQCCDTFENPFMFYNLDVSDNDIVVFFNYLVSGIQRHCRDFGRRTKSIIPQTRNIEILAGTFINEFVEYFPHPSLPYKGEGITRRDEFYIILDDYHNLQQNKDIGHALDYLLRHSPANLHVIISSRSTPPLNIAYYYAKQELFKIEKEQMQFNLKEIQELMHGVYALNVPDAEIERIEKHSEGWITAVQLILQKISTAGEDRVKKTLNGYIASGEEVFNYFAHEVFDSLPSEVQQFLMKTSILENITPEICKEVMKINNPKEILRYLLDEHLFVSHTNNNFRYHPLFKDFLFISFKERYGESEIDRLTRSIAKYFEMNRDLIPATNYYLRCKMFDKAARAIEKQTAHLVTTGDSNQFILWIEQIPMHVLYRHPILLVGKAEICNFLGKWDEAFDILEAITRHSKTPTTSIKAKLLYIKGIILFRRGKFKKSLRMLNKALEYVYKKDAFLQAKIHHTLGWIKLRTGLYPGAATHFQRGMLLSQKVKHRALIAEMINSLAVLEVQTGNLDKALEHYESLIRQFGNDDTLNVINIYGNAASVNMDKGNFAKALKLIEKAEDLATKYNDHRSLIYLTGAKANYYLRLKKYDTAVNMYEKVLSMNQKFGEMTINLFAYNDLASAYKAKGNYGRCAEYLKKAEKIIKDKKGTAYLDHLFLKAQLKSILKGYADAKAYLKEMLYIAKSIGSYKYIFKAYLQIIRTAIQQEENGQVLTNLRRMVTLAKNDEQSDLMLQECSTNLDLFGVLLNKGIAQKCCAEILGKLDNKEARDLLAQKYQVAAEQKPLVLRIDLFGGLQVKKESGSKIQIHWLSKKAKSLFGYLLAERKTLCYKDLLIENFWPKAGIKEGRHNLQMGITFLRKTLFNILDGQIDKKAILLYANDCYSWNAGIVFKLDNEEFDELIHKAVASEKKNKRRSHGIYQKALGIYKGDYCADIFDQWCEQKRIYYRELCCRVLKKMAVYQFNNRRYGKSLSLYRRALMFNKFDATIQRGIKQNLAMIRNSKYVNLS